MTVERNASPAIAVRVAEWVVASRRGTLSTLGLGSCVAIVLYDAVAQVGGLAHVLLPDTAMSRDPKPGKFPSTAVPIVLAEMGRQGAVRSRVRARLAGGASMFAALLPSIGIHMGERNVIATREALMIAGVPIDAEDVGSDYGRSVYLCLEDGSVEVRSVRRGTRVL
jgi:chemotaxis protein CheD